MELYGDVVLRFVSGSFQVSCSLFHMKVQSLQDMSCNLQAVHGGLQTACTALHHAQLLVA